MSAAAQSSFFCVLYIAWKGADSGIFLTAGLALCQQKVDDCRGADNQVTENTEQIRDL